MSVTESRKLLVVLVTLMILEKTVQQGTFFDLCRSYGAEYLPAVSELSCFKMRDVQQGTLTFAEVEQYCSDAADVVTVKTKVSTQSE